MTVNKVISKNLVVLPNFEKFTTINVESKTLDCEWSHVLHVCKGKFLKVNSQQTNFHSLLCINYHLCKISFTSLHLTNDQTRKINLTTAQPK